MLTVNHSGIALLKAPVGGIKGSCCGDERGIEGLSAYHTFGTIADEPIREGSGGEAAQVGLTCSTFLY